MPAHAGHLPGRPGIVALEALADPTGELSLEQALDLYREGRFRRQADLRFHTADSGIHWLRLQIAMPPGVAPTGWSLDCNWNFLRLLDWYFPDSPGTPSRQSGDGNFHLPSTCPLPSAPPGELTVYIRAAGYGGFNITPVVRSRAEVRNFATMRPWLLGLFAGVLTSMLVYNLFLFLSLRDESYFFYVINAALLLLYYGFSSGAVFDFFPDFPGQSHNAGLLSFEIIAACLFMTIGFFTRSFLLTRRHSPMLDRLLLGQIVLSVLLLATTLLLPPKTVLHLGPAVGLFTAATVTLAAVARLAQGFKPAGIFLAGWGVYVLCGAVHSLSWLGIVPATPLTFHAPMFGTAVEVLVMSLALASRVKLLREQSAQAERERQRLARENILLSMVLDDRRFGIGVVKDGRFQFANRQLSRHLGRDNLTGTPLAEVPHALRLLEKAPDLCAGQTDAERETVVVVNGGGRSLRATGRLLDPDRPQEGTVWIVEDISEQNRLEMLRNDVDQIMRHDLKSPLATIASLQEALELAGPLTQRQKDFAAMIERNIDVMTSRINLSLYLYKMEAGTLCLTPQPVALAPLLEEARQSLHPLLASGRTRLEVTFTAPAGAFVVLGEPLLLSSLCLNLLRNALEAAQDLGPVTVLVENPQAPRIVITNPGETPPEIRDRFFEKYVTSGKKKGTGLGTYSARLIARNLGGDVCLDTSRPGYTTVEVIGFRPA